MVIVREQRNINNNHNDTIRNIAPKYVETKLRDAKGLTNLKVNKHSISNLLHG